MYHFSDPSISLNPSEDESDPRRRLVAWLVVVDAEFIVPLRNPRVGPGDVPGDREYGDV